MRKNPRLVIFSLLVLLAAMFSVNAQKISTNITNKDRQSLRKRFGIVIPQGVLQCKRYKLSKGVVLLLINLPKESGAKFYSDTIQAPRPLGTSATINGPECQAGNYCTNIGFINLPDDLPEDVDWQGKSNFESDAIAVFSQIRGHRYHRWAGFFADLKNGLVMLWYKD